MRERERERPEDDDGSGRDDLLGLGERHGSGFRGGRRGGSDAHLRHGRLVFIQPEGKERRAAGSVGGSDDARAACLIRRPRGTNAPQLPHDHESRVTTHTSGSLGEDSARLLNTQSGTHQDLAEDVAN